MFRRYAQIAISCAVIACLPSTSLFAAAGTSIIASKGQQAYVNPGWPKGVSDIVNDPARTTGWNDWFSEWPNDVNQYAFEITSMEDLNRLVRKLGESGSKLRQVRLCPIKEPNGLGWTTSLPKGNSIPVLFSVGDQSRIDEWYKHVRKPFGVMEFIAAPVAVPPTLTIFVQHDLVKLEQLEVPAGITVSEGYAPTVFHRSNTKQEEQAAKEKPQPPKKSSTEPLDEKTRAATERIKTFLKARDNIIE